MNQNQIHALSNLRPETVLGLQDVSFSDRARALPGVLEVWHSFGDVDFTGPERDEEEIDVSSLLRLQPETCERMVVTQKYAVVGGLIYDEGRQDLNPLEAGCANGSIYHYGRRASGNEEVSFYRALGYDRYGDKDFNSDAVCAELGNLVWDVVRKKRKLRMALRRILKQSVRRHHHTVESAIKWAASCGGGEDYVADAFTGAYAMYRLEEEAQEDLRPLWDEFERQQDKAWDLARRAGRIGNPLAVMLDIYEHGGIAYSLSSQGMQCAWDTSSCGAVWVPDEEAEENIRYHVLHQLGVGSVQWFGAVGSQTDPLHARYSLDGGKTWNGSFQTWASAVEALVEVSPVKVDPSDLEQLLFAEARRYCKGILEEYNAWVNGEVYGVVVYVIDRETGERIESKDDECWGHIGQEYAEETLEDAILDTVVRLEAQLH